MASHWSRYCSHLLRYEDLGISLDTSRMGYGENFISSMQERVDRALADMAALESGAIANPDEGRMVGHYWLRDSNLAPAELAVEIERDLRDVKSFAADIHAGKITAPGGKKFTTVLVIGIGGSALGPQLVSDALAGPASPMRIAFLDNTDPAGIAKTLATLAPELATTLALVISKSGGTPETRNGMLEAEAAFTRAGLSFPAHAVAITGPDSKLDRHAVARGWIQRFPMADWVGGRTSVMSVVGLVPAALQGVDLDAFLAGARAMDQKTRAANPKENLSLLLALMWYHAGCGKGKKDMVVLPYKDSLLLFAKYLQQLVMESLGKEQDLDGNVVNQGIAVYGNKGSTDQHAYVQQLRDGVNNFFATFIEVREGGVDSPLEVEPGATSGDFLQGFLRGTRAALAGSGRESLTLSVPRVDAFYLGTLIAAFERAVSFYASLIHINAYHQPGVEAGKKAAAGFLDLLGRVRAQLAAHRGQALTAEGIATTIAADPEDVHHALMHASANDPGLTRAAGPNPAADTFTVA
jgi:glucose-6-phosphate isomerase